VTEPVEVIRISVASGASGEWAVDESWTFSHGLRGPALSSSTQHDPPPPSHATAPPPPASNAPRQSDPEIRRCVALLINVIGRENGR
jgi:hypothetical protein